MNKKQLPQPKCPYCTKDCSPSGGLVHPTEGRTTFWSCWNCDYHVEDIEEEKIVKEKKSLEERKESLDIHEKLLTEMWNKYYLELDKPS